MDPLQVLCEDVFPIIFQHLSVRDILKSSLVSTSWNGVVGNSSTCMKKIYLRFYWPLNNLDVLSKSLRKYQSCKVQRGIPSDLVPMFNKAKWRKVMIRDMPSMDYDKLVALMTQLAPSVEELDLWDVGNSFSFSTETSILFPRLQVLEMSLSTRQMFSLFANHNPQLREVKLTQSRTGNFPSAANELIEAPVNLFNQFLSNNRHLEVLSLDGVEEMFSLPITAKVTGIKRIVLTASFERSTEMENLLKFVAQQTKIREIIILENILYNSKNVFENPRKQFLADLLKAAKLPRLQINSLGVFSKYIP